jgi:hypothetical protein
MPISKQKLKALRALAAKAADMPYEDLIEEVKSHKLTDKERADLLQAMIKKLREKG